MLEEKLKGCCLFVLLWAVRRYTGMTFGFRSQGVEQFVRGYVCSMILDIRSFEGTIVRGE